VSLRAGKFKPPVGLERLQSDDDTNFIERSFPTLLVPSRDIGYQLSGDIVKRRVNYAVGIFNGVADNSLSDAPATSRRDFAARIFLTPFQPDHNLLSGLGVGMGATDGSVDGIPLPAYKTLGQATFFNFNSGVVSDGHRTRLAPQMYYYLGPFGLLSEFTRADEGFQKGDVRHPFSFRAWQVAATYLLTGETKSFGTLVPKHNFDPFSGAGNHGWGALELALRVGDFEADRALFNDGFADITKTPRRAHEWLGGVNWYLNRNLVFKFNAGNTNFAGGSTGGADRPAEKTLLSRFQLNF
jgi:phosphate-selective porin OprO/OprP